MKSISHNVFCGVLTITTLFTNDFAQAQEEVIVKIGHAAPKTGFLAYLGIDSENGAALAVQEINSHENLMVGNKRIRLELIGEDDEAQPKLAHIVAQKLVDAGVTAVVGHMNSGLSIPANAIYAAAGIPQISPSSTSPAYTKHSEKTPMGNISAYRVVSNDESMPFALASYVVKHTHFRNILVLNDGTNYGYTMAGKFLDALDNKSINTIIESSLSDKMVNFKPILKKYAHANIDAVFWGGLDDTAIHLARDTHSLGWSAPIIGADGMCTDYFAVMAGIAGDNAICSINGIPTSEMKLGERFDQNYRKMFPGMRVQIYSPYSYDAVYTLAEAIKIANSIKPEAIAKALRQVDFEGLTGRIRFDESGDVECK